MAHKRPGYPPIPDKDIDTILKEMKRINPEVTREMAIKKLEKLQETIHDWNIDDQKGLKEFKKSIDREKKMKTN